MDWPTVKRTGDQSGHTWKITASDWITWAKMTVIVTVSKLSNGADVFPLDARHLQKTAHLNILCLTAFLDFCTSGCSGLNATFCGPGVVFHRASWSVKFLYICVGSVFSFKVVQSCTPFVGAICFLYGKDLMMSKLEFCGYYSMTRLRIETASYMLHNYTCIQCETEGIMQQ